MERGLGWSVVSVDMIHEHVNKFRIPLTPYPRVVP